MRFFAIGGFCGEQPLRIAAAASGLVLLAMALFMRTEAQQTPPPPQPDPSIPNLFYGAIPPTGGHGPVIVFVHGLSATAYYWWNNNAMYQMAYQGGYRTAFISLNADNTPNTASIAQNAAMLTGLLPKIAAHYNVPQFYVVAHSKGGLDTQSALLNPQIASLVKAVICLATPNQGTPLADWAYGPGKPVAGALGLLTPAVYDLRTSNVASFRAQADPVLTSSGIFFYTLAGTLHINSVVLGVTGRILDNLTNNEQNDGMVPEPDTMLPYGYSMSMGTLPVNHFDMGQGEHAFSFIDGQIKGLENSQLGGIQRIATNGFGDLHNTWAWSMAWFKGKLYVGTGRDAGCVISADADLQVSKQFPALGHLFYPPGNENCAVDMKDLTLAAEIWAYTPETHSWQRVYQSPQDIPLGLDSSLRPTFAAEDIGFRGMTVFTEADGTQALYVGGVSAQPVYFNVPPYDTQGYPPPRILRTVDGVNWTALPHDPGTFLGDINKTSDAHVIGFRSLMVYNGQMFCTASDYKGQGIIIGSAKPSQGNNAWYRVSPPTAQFPLMWVLASYNNFLYAGGGQLQSGEGFSLYKTNASGTPPYKFIPIITNGGYQTNKQLLSQAGMTMAIYNGLLYMGTNRNVEMVQVQPNDTWSLVVGEPRPSTPVGPIYATSGLGQGFGSTFNRHFWQMGVSNLGLTLGTFDWSTDLIVLPPINKDTDNQNGYDLYQTNDMTYWNVVTKTGLGDGTNVGFRTNATTPYGYFFGSARRAGGFQVWLNNSVLDFNHDGVIDQRDVNILTAALNTKALPNDPRDLDRDGMITALDVRKLVTQCKYPGCAVVSPVVKTVAPAPTLPAPQHLKAAAERIVGPTVQLTWDATAGAVRYHVYRWTTQPLGYFIRPGNNTITIPQLNMTLTIPNDILAGKLDFLCTPTLTVDSVCEMVDLIKAAGGSQPRIGFPTTVQEIAITSNNAYQEPAPTPFQSVYYVRAEDTQGNLSPPSNIVGGPSKAYN